MELVIVPAIAAAPPVRASGEVMSWLKLAWLKMVARINRE
jgi:hypothetical protein